RREIRAGRRARRRAAGARRGEGSDPNYRAPWRAVRLRRARSRSRRCRGGAAPCGNGMHAGTLVFLLSKTRAIVGCTEEGLLTHLAVDALDRPTAVDRDVPGDVAVFTTVFDGAGVVHIEHIVGAVRASLLDAVAYGRVSATLDDVEEHDGTCAAPARRAKHED